MSVSETHEKLVLKLIDWVENNADYLEITNLFSDTSINTSNYLKPPNIGGFIRDLYAHNLNQSFYVIGEAKTSIDLERPEQTNKLELI